LGNSDVLSNSGRHVTRGSDDLRNGGVLSERSRHRNVFLLGDSAAKYQPDSRVMLQGDIGITPTL
jgi:hypothetical protein